MSWKWCSSSYDTGYWLVSCKTQMYVHCKFSQWKSSTAFLFIWAVLASMHDAIFIIDVTNCSSHQLWMFCLIPSAVSYNFGFWWYPQTHIEWVPKLPVRIHHARQRLAHLLNPLCIVRRALTKCRVSNASASFISGHWWLYSSNW